MFADQLMNGDPTASSGNSAIAGDEGLDSTYLAQLRLH